MLLLARVHYRCRKYIGNSATTILQQQTTNSNSKWNNLNISGSNNNNNGLQSRPIKQIRGRVPFHRRILPLQQQSPTQNNDRLVSRFLKQNKNCQKSYG